MLSQCAVYVVENVVRQTSTSFLALISRALRTTYDDIAKEPLPERWVDLIKHLNERERTQQTGDQNDHPSPDAPRRVH
jgi:hypothetical protein